MGNDPPLQAKQRVYRAVLDAVELAAANAAANAALINPPGTPVTLPIAGIVRSKAVLVAVGIWLVGGGTGAVLYGLLRPEQVRVMYVERPLPSAVAAASAVGTAHEPQAAANPVDSGVAPPVAPSPKKRTSIGAVVDNTSELARERAMLDLARARAAQGEPALVLEQVEQHLREFPRGRLAEEREALAIRALMSLDRRDEAQARAQLFRASYPNSFLTSVLDSALSAP
jgi:hypothetical protein